MNILRAASRASLGEGGSGESLPSTAGNSELAAEGNKMAQVVPGRNNFIYIVEEPHGMRWGCSHCSELGVNLNLDVLVPHRLTNLNCCILDIPTASLQLYSQDLWVLGSGWEPSTVLNRL